MALLFEKEGKGTLLILRLRVVGGYSDMWGYSVNLCFKSKKSQRLKRGRTQIIASTLANDVFPII